jgi:hypothetical protein
MEAVRIVSRRDRLGERSGLEGVVAAFGVAVAQENLSDIFAGVWFRQRLIRVDGYYDYMMERSHP